MTAPGLIEGQPLEGAQEPKVSAPRNLPRDKPAPLFDP
jgi:hypothetical protein